MEITSGLAEVNGTKLYYESAGNGPALIFLNAGGLDCRMWDDQFAAFAEHYRVTRYDYRGWGRSEAVREKFSHIEDLRALLDFLKADAAILVGATLGGRLAIDFALAHPRRVRALVLSAPWLSGFQWSESMEKRLAALLGGTSAGAEKFVKGILDDPHFVPAPENPAAREKVRQILTENFQNFSAAADLMAPPEKTALGRLATIGVPALICLGGRDHHDLLAVGETLESDIPGAKTVVFFGAGHLVNLENPQRFNKTVLEFLSER
ncbi:MAG TPA: alpha/beta fold hydrolase [Candidatus Acidoferrales bacterium]|nr:alpha/beta fold hydrolase [Candidatus Acidoferrales bacterium]